MNNKLKEIVEEKFEILRIEFQKVLDDCKLKKMSLAEANQEAHDKTAYINEFIINSPSYQLYKEERWGKKS